MSKNTINGLLASMSNKARAASSKTAAAVTGTAIALSPGLAFAQSGDFDGADIIAKVVTYTAIGISILAAFALGRWSLRAMGLIGGK